MMYTTESVVNGLSDENRKFFLTLPEKSRTSFLGRLNQPVKTLDERFRSFYDFEYESLTPTETEEHHAKLKNWKGD